LYSAFLGNFVYAVLGSSKDITVGPTAVMSLLIGTMAVSPVPGNPTYAAIVSLVGGCLQIFMSVFRLGQLKISEL
jgi:sodium-independent sulfate anion transporter 11